MDEKEYDNDIKDIQYEKDLLKMPLNLNEEKYILKIYPSKDNINIVFKLEKEKIQTYYYFEKFDLRDFRQTNKCFISDGNVQEVFIHLKDIAKKSDIILEKKEIKINLVFNNKNDVKSVIKFNLRKKIVSQDRLNPILVEQIQDNKYKIKILKNQITKLDNCLQAKNDVVDNINNNITNINNILNNIKANSVNNSNSTKNSSSNEDNSENASINNSSNNNDDDEEEENLKNNTNYIYHQKENESKRGKKKKKNKNNYKKIKFVPYENNNTNKNDTTLFCFESMEIFQNKKIIELLIILNVVTILIVMYILGSIYNLKTNLDNDKIRDDDFMNKMGYLSFIDDTNDEDFGNYRDIFRENIDLQLKKKEEERITSSKLKEEFLDDRKRKIQERRKRNNK